MLWSSVDCMNEEHVVLFTDNIVDLCKTKYSKFVVKSLLKYW